MLWSTQIHALLLFLERAFNNAKRWKLQNDQLKNILSHKICKYCETMSQRLLEDRKVIGLKKDQTFICISGRVRAIIKDTKHFGRAIKPCIQALYCPLLMKVFLHRLLQVEMPESAGSLMTLEMKQPLLLQRSQNTMEPSKEN